MLCLLLALVATAAALASQSDTITVPHLSGIFVALDNVTSARTVSGWTEDLAAMKAIGIKFLVLRAVAQGCSPPQCAPISPACPLGGFRAAFPTKGAGRPACFVEEHVGIDTVENVFAAAEAVGLGVHLGLAYPVTSSIAKTGLNSTAYFRYLASVNWDLAHELWTRYVVERGHTIAGFYTDVEESNSIGELALMNDLVGHYLEPVARDMKVSLSPDILVWASPYYVGNLTRHPAASWMGPRFYADWWGQVFAEASHLDLIAPQDSMGAQGNSFQNVTDFLSQLALESRVQSRAVWSNVELFEVWPQNCQWSNVTGICRGRHPAPWSRIKEQMANEAKHVDAMIAWEWHSCLSPFGSNPNWTKPLYDQYLAYINAGTRQR